MKNPVSPFFGDKAASLRGWKKLVLCFLPLHVTLQLKSEILARLFHWRGHKTQKDWQGRNDLKINIGCGSRGLSGWVNVDFAPMDGVTVVCDCRKRLPFDDGSAKVVFSEHFFEHLDYTEEAPLFLAECRRILRPGGVLRIVVPDAGRYLQAYHSPGWEEISRLRKLDESHFDPYSYSHFRTKMELINEVFRQAYTHKFAYDEETLVQVLQDAGFKKIVPQQFGSSLDPDLSIDLLSRAHESLYVEAVRDTP